MGLIEFDPVLLTGVEEIDLQHRELFARLERLLEASRAHRSRDEVAEFLEFLATYAVEHFAGEEAIMAGGAYPGAAAHREEHRRFVEELEGFRRRMTAGGPTPALVMQVGSRTTEWLREHIYRTDRALGSWLRSRPGPQRGSGPT